MIAAATKGVKDVIKAIPPVKRLLRYRDALLVELANLASQNETLTAKNASLILENQSIQTAQHALLQERNALVSGRDTLVRERDELVGHLRRISKNNAEAEVQITNIGASSDEKMLAQARAEWAGQHGEIPFVPNGHFYSPITSRDELLANEHRIFAKPPVSLTGINFNVSDQLALVERFGLTYKDLPFEEQASRGLRYRYHNSAYGYGDAIYLYSMIRHVKPKRIIEVGSGFSSCVTLDTNELWFSNAIECTFVEPYPDLLLSLLKDGDRARVTIIPDRVQEVSLDVFGTLESGDILFIDSTHVSKIGSDVNYLFFVVLPNLAPGVVVHIHDIFYPFEYPKAWAIEGRAWNEDYLLRAFLQYNSEFEIVLFGDYLAQFYKENLREHLPLVLNNTGGSIWLKKRDKE